MTERGGRYSKKEILFIVPEEKIPYEYFLDKLGTHIMNTEIDRVLGRLFEEGIIKGHVPDEYGAYDFAITISSTGTKGADYTVAIIDGLRVKMVLENRGN